MEEKIINYLTDYLHVLKINFLPKDLITLQLTLEQNHKMLSAPNNRKINFSSDNYNLPDKLKRFSFSIINFSCIFHKKV